jgi:hypothetical protein
MISETRISAEPRPEALGENVRRLARSTCEAGEPDLRHEAGQILRSVAISSAPTRICAMFCARATRSFCAEGSRRGVRGFGPALRELVEAALELLGGAAPGHVDVRRRARRSAGSRGSLANSSRLSWSCGRPLAAARREARRLREALRVELHLGRDRDVGRVARAQRRVLVHEGTRERERGARCEPSTCS